MTPAALQAVQAMWEDNLGLQVALVPKSLEAFSQARREGIFQVCLTGWAGDYGQPAEFFDLFLTDSVYNSAKWSNADYDSAIATAKEATDIAAAMQAYQDVYKRQGYSASIAAAPDKDSLFEISQMSKDSVKDFLRGKFNLLKADV